MDSAVTQAQQMFDNLAKAKLNYLDPASAISNRSVAALPGGQILKSDGSSRLAPAYQELLQKAIQTGWLNPETKQAGQALTPRGIADPTAPQMPTNNIIKQPGIPESQFQPVSNSPQTVKDQLEKNTPVDDMRNDVLFKLFKTTVNTDNNPSDPIATTFQRVMQQNPGLTPDMKLPLVWNTQEVQHENPFAQYAKQFRDSIISRIISQYGNFGTQTPNEVIPITPIYTGANNFNNRVY